MGKIYKQLSIEERTMIQTQLAMGRKPAADCSGAWVVRLGTFVES